VPAVRHALNGVSKRIYQTVRWRGLDRPKILMIVGCQRSGSALLSRILDADRDCRVFAELSVLSGLGKEGVRLNPLPDVAAVLSRVPAPLVVLQPLVETQRVRTLLNYFPNSKALFMYQGYADVASADLRNFGPRAAIDNLRPIAQGSTHDWRSSGATPAVREEIRRFFSDSMSPDDAAALFWFARNHLYQDLELAGHSEVMLCRYEDLAARPSTVVERIYDFVGVTCPEDTVQAPLVDASPAGRGKGLALLPEVRALCEQLQARLDTQYQLQSQLPAPEATGLPQITSLSPAFDRSLS
jgi:hypothetical protein